jgi:hypothetical protein
MRHLITTPNLEDADQIYEQLTKLHDGKTSAESLRINARLILIFINQIGNPSIISEAFELAVKPYCKDQRREENQNK